MKEPSITKNMVQTGRSFRFIQVQVLEYGFYYYHSKFNLANLQGYNLNTNFCTVILGANAQNNYNLIFTVASGLPMGIGILIIYPLSKKFTVRKTTMAFSLISIIGCIMGLFFKDDFIVAVISYFIFNVGTLASLCFRCSAFISQ